MVFIHLTLIKLPTNIIVIFNILLSDHLGFETPLTFHWIPIYPPIYTQHFEGTLLVHETTAPKFFKLPNLERLNETLQRRNSFFGVNNILFSNSKPKKNTKQNIWIPTHLQRKKKNHSHPNFVPSLPIITSYLGTTKS